MFRIAFAISALCSLVSSTNAAEPKFTFLKSETTEKHIAIQPKDEHHRIYFPLQIENANGKTVFARVRCKTQDGEPEHVQSVSFSSENNKEIWRVYLRAPQYKKETATYQIEVGAVDFDQIDPEQVSAAFGWQVQRHGGRVNFASVIKNADLETPVVIPITVRKAVVVGGEVRIVSEKMLPDPPKLIFGLDNKDSANHSVDGSGAIRISK
jgi:hypothetical protein